MRGLEMPVEKSPPAVKALTKRTAAKKVATASKAPAPTVKTAPAEKKAPKQRVRLVRDSFTMPEPDFALIAALKGRAMAAQREAKKSELLRAGLHALMALDGASLVDALGRLQPLKVGRPKKGH
jgi:hypothetical protein